MLYQKRFTTLFIIILILLLTLIPLLSSCRTEKTMIPVASLKNTMNQYILHYPIDGSTMYLTFDDFESEKFHAAEALDYEFALYIDDELIERVNRNSFTINISDFTEVPHDIQLAVYKRNGNIAHSVINEKVMIYNEAKHKEQIDNYKNAEVLYLYGDINDFTVFENLNNIKSFEVTNGRMGDLSPLSNLKDLKRVYFEYTYGITDISPLEDLESLEVAAFFHCNDLENVKPLSEIETLKYVFLADCDQVHDITPLSTLANLEYLYYPKTDDLVGLDAFEDTDVILR